MRRVAIALWILGGAAFVVSQVTVGVAEMPLWIGVLVYLSLVGIGAAVWGRSDPVYDYRAAAAADEEATATTSGDRAVAVIERSRDPRVP